MATYSIQKPKRIITRFENTPCARGEIQGFELQPIFNLQPAFKKQDKSFQAITYIADFLVYLPNGEVEVIDIKGVITETFNVKRKLFEYTYPHLQLILLKHVKKYGGFITLDEYNKLQRAEKENEKQNKGSGS